MNPRHAGYLFCALAMPGVGSTVVVSRTVAAGLPPFTATALRLMVALPLFVLLMHCAAYAGRVQVGATRCS